jgi:hypothetical protein
MDNIQKYNICKKNIHNNMCPETFNFWVIAEWVHL